MSRCVVVIGQHRGGTSATAGVLWRLGVDMNPTSGTNIGDDHEDRELYLLNEMAVGGWWRPVNNFMAYQEQYAALLAKRDEKDLWGFKDPRLVFFWEDITNLIESNIYLVRVQRPIEASARSLVVRDSERLPHLTYHEAVLLTARYEWRANVIYRLFEKKRRFWLEYNNLIDHTEREVKHLAKWLDLPVTQDAIDFVHKDLRHHD